jgi:putative tricarboxylic transport membrane protein
MLKSLAKAESLIAAGIMAFAVYFMVYAVRLPIGWDAARGPGGGAFPFWLSLTMFLAAGAIWLRAVLAGRPKSGTMPFFEPGMIGSVIGVTVALAVTIALMPIVGAYIALPLFMVWYLRFFGQNSWTITAILSLATPVVLFFFFEVALRILLPKGVTEPLFLPLYAAFF